MSRKHKVEDSSDDESVEEGMNVALKEEAADWGKTKYDYYYTDYVDKDYPSSLTAKEEKLARLEQEEALRIQKKLLSTLDNVNYSIAIDDEADQEGEEDLISFIEEQNRKILSAQQEAAKTCDGKISKKKKKVKFDPQSEQQAESDGCAFNSDSDESVGDDGSDQDFGQSEDEEEEQSGATRKRRPINMAMKKNRGLTPYKKKEYRNPRVKHKLKYKKALSKRRHMVKEAQVAYHRYSGEATGIKTSTIRSIKLC